MKTLISRNSRFRDHQGQLQTFQFTVGGGVGDPDFIPIRIDAGLPDL